ncbi:MAG: 5-amino-6-(5-phosphoribosylamino)uracil reductase [Chthonomonadales bacterium]|nr:5-amino-6-(5-phosphoribosylamino)uracil reductase [Chthonomonadales bacterium]
MTENRTRTTDVTLPKVLLSCAITLDGYLNDLSPERLQLSSEADRDAVDALRAAADAVMVGVGTVMTDDPALTVRSPVRQAARQLAGRPRQPLRVVLAGHRRLDDLYKVTGDGLGATLVYGTEGAHGRNVEYVRVASRDMVEALRDLSARGIARVLVEGGEAISSEVLRRDLADVLRVAIAPCVVGRSRSPRIAGRLRSGLAQRLSLAPAASELLGDTSVLYLTRNVMAGSGAFRPGSDAEWLAEAIELGRRCPASQTAYSVGAWIVGPDGEPIASGHSRELDEHVHAEEAALRKAARLRADLADATLYTSMEPCSVRLSGRTSCCQHIADAGIRRVVFAQREPPHFVRCDGVATLRSAGIEVVEISALSEYAAALNQHVGQSSQSR